MKRDGQTPGSIFSARRLGLAVLAALLLVLALRLFVVRSYRVSSHAMSETILPGDWVLVSRLSYNFGDPRRGDVVCFTSPGAGGQDFFGRVIALGGETLEIRDGLVYIDDDAEPLDEPYVSHTRREDFGPVVVPEGRLFILGDNRAEARDSRVWGPLNAGLVHGEALGIFFSSDPYAVSLWPIPEAEVRWERIAEPID